MKTFICLDCGTKWFSAGLTEHPCGKCGGEVIEILDSEEQRVSKAEKT
ncbi:MAG TPA: hypothetical protein PKA10_09510 [Selenomonadales bacterium]|nr:hypothetical protein [Selenomonadales bacterium]